MRLLLDTHTLIWWLEDDRKLGRRTRGLIQDDGNEVLVSAVSLWEIAVKVRVGKLEADVRRIARRIGEQGFEWLDIRDVHLAVLASLVSVPGHKDPFDHLLIAQAITEGAVLLSNDRFAAAYPVGVLFCAE